MTGRFGESWSDEMVASGSVQIRGRGAGVETRSWVEPLPLVDTVHGPMRSVGDAPVKHGAQCMLCEWAYCGSQRVLPSADSVAYGYGSPDVLEVIGWAEGHVRSMTHTNARAHAELVNRRKSVG